MAVADAQKLTHGFARANGVRLHYVEAGEGPLVLLLHGFPQYWYSWRRQLEALANAGFRAVAPDLRGYNLSDKPAGVASYRMEALVDDVAALAAHFGATSCTLVGHDWGGAIAWSVAMARPALVERLVVLNAPHPLALGREVKRKNWRQLWRSFYIFLFQLPWIPEGAMRGGGFAVVRRVFREEPTRPGAFSDEEIECYVAALREPGALEAAVNYYRAALRHRRAIPRESRTIAVPTLLVWGDRDPHLGVELSEGLERWVTDLRVEHLPEASHWVLEDEPERVTRLLVDFAAAGRPSTAHG